MTPTEEFLSGVLAAEAAGITRDSLRPLSAPAQEIGRRPSNLFRSPRLLLSWRPSALRGTGGFRVLAAIAAAASVLAAIGLVVAARSVFSPAPPFSNVGTATSPPPYYVEIDPNDRIIVQSTATGRRTDIVTPPRWVHGTSNGDAGLTVSTDGRTFVAACNDLDALETNLFRFTLTGSGQVAGFSRMRTGRLPGLTETSLAISPDGTQIALAGIPDRSRLSYGPPRLAVVNLTTGRVRTWHGLARTDEVDSIEDPAWVTNESLRFLVATCGGYRDAPDNAACAYSGPVGREWTVSVPPGPGPLGVGRVLLALPGATVQALSGPGGSSVTALELLRSGGIRVAQYAVPTGRLMQILYQGRGNWKSNDAYAGLAVDRSGKYLLINEDLGGFFGWIGDGRFHKLPIHGLYGFDEIVAAAW